MQQCTIGALGSKGGNTAHKLQHMGKEKS